MWHMTGASSWTSGFFPGLLWQLYDITKAEKWASLALNWTEGIRDEQHDGGSHDIGFKVFGSFGYGLLLAGDESKFPGSEVARLGYKEVVQTAAKTLTTRFDERVGCTKSWNSYKGVCSTDHAYTSKFPVIIDNMMNLELLFWAAANGGDANLYRIAESHANKTAVNHVREDGSTFHVVDYDPETGTVARKCTHQGLNDTSTWSRGQAWCAYGFTMAYRFTQLPLHLQTAERCTRYFLARMAETSDEVALWDFDWPGERGLDQRDVSASAIFASSLLELAQYSQDAARFNAAAVRIIDAIGVPATGKAGYIGEFSKTQGALVHATVLNPAFRADALNVSLVYSSYYAAEALRRTATVSPVISVI